MVTHSLCKACSVCTRPSLAGTAARQKVPRVVPRQAPIRNHSTALWGASRAFSIDRQRYCAAHGQANTAPNGIEGDKVNVLFVCLGNICRSPTAEAVFKDRVKKAKLEGRFFVDSCGLGGGNEDWYLDKGWAYHEGHQADERMRETAASRGVTLTSRSRPLRHDDLSTFDYILGMDYENMALIQIAADHWADKYPVPRNYQEKVSLMCKHLPDTSQHKGTMEVPDPYFDDDAQRRGFHRVLDLLIDACEGLLDHAIKDHQLKS